MLVKSDAHTFICLQVICRQLNYTGGRGSGTYLQYSYGYQNDGVPIWSCGFACNGNETSVKQCSRPLVWEDAPCSRGGIWDHIYGDVAVVCNQTPQGWYQWCFDNSITGGQVVGPFSCTLTTYVHDANEYMCTDS